jgi:RNA polymerase sigma-70 factor (ECF subfamily)
VVEPTRTSDPAHDVFGSLYQEHASRVRALVRRRIRDNGLVEDIVQETFVRAHRGIAHFDDDRSPWPWLATVARNLCIDAARQRARVREDLCAELPRAVLARSDAHSDPHARLMDRNRLRGLKEAMSSLSDKERRVLLMREVDGLCYDDLAELEGLTLDAIKSMLKRARRTVRASYAALADSRGLAGIAGLTANAMARARNRLGRVPHAASVWSRVGLPLEAMASAVAATLMVTTAVLVGPGDVHPGGGSIGNATRVVRPGVEQRSVGPTESAPRGGSRATPSPGGSKASLTAARAAGAGPIDAGADTAFRRGENLTLNAKVFAKTPARRDPLEGGGWADIECMKNEVRETACGAVDLIPEPGG